MNEHEVTELLDRLGSQEEVGNPSMGDLFRAGRRIRRRRHAFRLAGVATAVTVVIAGGFALQPDRGRPTSTAASSPPVSTPTVTRSATLEAPAGMRFVGEGSVVVAVPETWTTNDIVCGSVGSDTVTFNNDGPWAMCSAGDPRASVLAVVDPSSSQWATRLQLTADTVVVDGMSGLKTPTVCTATAVPWCSGTLTFPDENVSFLVTSVDDNLVDSILDSAQRLPAGFVTVPDIQGMTFADADQSLVSQGLLLGSPCAIGDDCSRGIVWPTSPGAGSAVPVGSTVTINLYNPALPPPPHGQIRGTLLISPPMAADHPSSGSIVISGPRNLTITIGGDGRFTASVPPGRYTVIGHSPEYGAMMGDCITQSGPVTVRPGRTVRVAVWCDEK